jgi:hypothetical protein
VKFQVFKNGKTVEEFSLFGTYLFGTDGISIRRTSITFKDGVIECKKSNLETAGLALLWPVDGFGKVLLPTTCLPERKQPYILNIEIARAKLMQITNKREDWSFFDAVEGMEEISKEAQDLFIRAIQNIQDPPTASRLADESLEKAMVFSEKLAVRQGQLSFNMRSKNHGFGRGCLGCRLDPAQIGNPRYMDRLFEGFGFVTIPINWARIEAQPGNYDFSFIDACISVLSKKKVVVGAGPLLRFSKDYLPKWLLHEEIGFEKIRETAFQFILKVVSRYAGSVHRWSSVGGVNELNQFNFNFEQMVEMTRAASMAVKAVSARALNLIEVSSPWGEYYGEISNSIPPVVYMDMVVQSGVNLDAFGLQMCFGKDASGMHIRDMMQISAILDVFAPMAKPIYITDVEIPSQSGTGGYDGKVAGIWHQKWDQGRQGRWIEQFYRIALSKPFIDAVTYANLADRDGSTIAHSGLLNEQFEPKESFATIKVLHNAVLRR